MDSSAVEPYDSGDEWDIGVGNLIIDLDADLEKDKLEMSSSKEEVGMTSPPSAVAVLPDNIKFVSPVATMQSKDGKSKSKRSKNSKDVVKASLTDGTKKDAQGRSSVDLPPQNSAPSKGTDKSSKLSRFPSSGKNDRDLVCGKAKKDKLEVAATRAFNTEEAGASVLPLGAPRSNSFESQQNPEFSSAEQFGDLALDSAGLGQAVTIITEQEEVDDGDCQNLKKLLSCDKVR